MITIVLLVLAAGVAALAPRLLESAAWVYRAPVLGIAAWYSALFSVVTGVGLAAASLMVPWPQAVNAMCSWWRVCTAALGGMDGPGGHAVRAVLAAVLTAVLVRGIAAMVRGVRRAGGERRDHGDAVSMVGVPAPELGVTVLEHDQPAAYLVPGPRRQVVVTRGAMELLSAGELAAVLAHERAHAAGRHHLLRDGARLLAAAFPRVTVFATANGQIARLVELQADHVAASRHAPMDLARALVALATGRAAPMEALGAAGGDAVERIDRMLCPPAPLVASARLVVLAVAVVVALAPVAVLASAWVHPVMAFCVLP